LQLSFSVDGHTISRMTELRQMHDLSPSEFAPLHTASTAEGFRFLSRLVAEWDAGAVRFDGAGERLLGGYDRGQLVAVGGLTRDPFSIVAGIGRLRRVYVLPNARKRGIGAQLVRALEWAAVGYFTELVLRTDTPTAARFYEALGYIPLPSGSTATHRRLVASATVGGAAIQRVAATDGRLQ
jgi:GNAT superfamily N-acetyltransferase